MPRKKIKEVSEANAAEEDEDEDYEEEEMKKLERLMKQERWSVGKGGGKMDRGGEKKVVLEERHLRRIEKL